MSKCQNDPEGELTGAGKVVEADGQLHPVPLVTRWSGCYRILIPVLDTLQGIHHLLIPPPLVAFLGIGPFARSARQGSRGDHQIAERRRHRSSRLERGRVCQEPSEAYGRRTESCRARARVQVRSVERDSPRWLELTDSVPRAARCFGGIFGWYEAGLEHLNVPLP